MGKTPDRFPGCREEEEIQLIPGTESPTENGMFSYRSGAGFEFYEEGAVKSLSGIGETNTASNIGVSGVGIYKEKIGVDLRFKKLNSGSSKVTVVDDVGNDEVDVDVVEEEISHANIGDIGTNSHSQIDNHISATSNPHSVTAAQAGAAATVHTHTEADITDLDHTDTSAIHGNVPGEISAISEKVSPISADIIMIEDSADSNNKKRIQVGNLPGGGGGGLATKSGSITQVAFGTSNRASIAFSSSFSDSNYSISLSASSAIAVPMVFWRNKAISGFDIYLHDNIPSGVTFIVDWTCVKHGES